MLKLPYKNDNVIEKYGKTPAPEEVFYYIYAILYSTTYRRDIKNF